MFRQSASARMPILRSWFCGGVRDINVGTCSTRRLDGTNEIGISVEYMRLRIDVALSSYVLVETVRKEGVNQCSRIISPLNIESILDADLDFLDFGNGNRLILFFNPKRASKQSTAMNQS